MVPGMKSVSIIDYLIDVANSRDIFGTEQTEKKKEREREKRKRKDFYIIIID